MSVEFNYVSLIKEQCLRYFNTFPTSSLEAAVAQSSFGKVFTRELMVTGGLCCLGQSRSLEECLDEHQSDLAICLEKARAGESVQMQDVAFLDNWHPHQWCVGDPPEG